VDPDAGLLEAIQVDESGKSLKDVNGATLTYKAKGRFKIARIPLEPTTQTDRTLHARSVRDSTGALNCARCSSPLTLPGEDLCAACWAQDRGQRHRMKVERITVPMFDKKCEKCSRLASWSVGDEVEVSPESGRCLGRAVLFTRGSTVGRHYFCDFHYRQPRLLDRTGEVVELVGVGNQRPGWHS
jgi:hypothetical protein